MMKTEQMQDLHRRVWEFRKETQDVWPTPDTLDALRFSFCEAGEAMDAYLRTKGGYARNNVKEPDLFGELADCALMLLTALGDRYKPYRSFDPITSTLEDIGEQTALAMCRCKVALQDRVSDPSALTYHWQSDVEDALRYIDNYPGMDLAAELNKRITRIRARHDKADAATGSA